MVKLLLKHKANPNDTDNEGNTALMWGNNLFLISNKLFFLLYRL